ncbi:MAG: alpha-glucan family phosphorylase [Chloroflexi bacterium]|nr:alpha-glucan family phosphorylase [Chloroflexota bacterium]
MSDVVIESLTSILPRRIAQLGRLAYNLWWTWQPEAQRMFRYLDRPLWEQVYHNPVKLLRQIHRKRLSVASRDKRFLALYDRVVADFDAYMSVKASNKRTKTWFEQYNQAWDPNKGPVAYFSFEFGLHECLPMYAGGLGILAGDHLKEASDMGLPFAGVGFLYLQGYFRQRITEDGWQEAQYDTLDFEQLPITQMQDDAGTPVKIIVDLPGRPVYLHLWKAQIGRIPLYLLDSDLEQNAPNDRTLTQRLYSPDPDTRIDQELLLGIGGVRALGQLGIVPAVWHMNEGHPAFGTLERARALVAGGRSFDEAKLVIAANTVFTTHTPVPAGNDKFPIWQIDRHLDGYWNSVGLTREQFLALGDDQGQFGMTPLALRMSAKANGVSELHGQVAREMWNWMYPGRETPIGHVTNGVHTQTWLARRMRTLFDKYLGADWVHNIDDATMWRRIMDIPNQEFWEVKKHLKRNLATFMRDRARGKWATHTQHPVQTVASGVLIDPNMLTIGFARRFATYKRASLIMHDIERLWKLVNEPGRPVQIIFAGKAHPQDEPGKRLIQELYRTVKDATSAGRLVFIEDYDMNVARFLVQGVDVWLNTPRRPYEASGTSGMKAALNGGLNLSILDGWWREASDGRNGWAIGTDTKYDNPDEQDAIDYESLFGVLENELVPLYYDVDDNDISAEWLARCKYAIATIAPQFSTRRMLGQYVREMYAPLAR